MTARFVFGGAQLVAFGAIQGLFSGFAHGGDFALVALHEMRLGLEETAAGFVIAFAHGLFGRLFLGSLLGGFAGRGLFGGAFGRRFARPACGFLGLAAAASGSGGAGFLRRSLRRCLPAG